MFFWIGLGVALVGAILVMAWGTKGVDERVHKPGSQHLR